MTMIRTQAALLLALLPTWATQSLHDDQEPAASAGKTDPVPGSGSMGRQGVLELLESGVISTDEALDLLDGIDQTSPAGIASPGGTAGPGRRPPRPGRPERPARPERPERPGRPARPGRRGWLGSDETERERELRFEESTGRHEETILGSNGKRTIRIRVDDASGSRVNLALPIGFLETGLRVAERFSPDLLGGSVGTSIRQAIGSGQVGTIVDVEDADGSHVRIAIE